MAMVMDDPILAAQINMTADMGTFGVSAHDFVHALNGSAKMEAAEGVLKGIDMAQQLSRSANRRQVRFSAIGDRADDCGGGYECVLSHQGWCHPQSDFQNFG